MKTLKLYFSFRSPYAWLGCYRFASIEDSLGVEYELIPISPPKNVAEQMMPPENKRKYIRQDIRRTAGAYGLQYKRPEPFDCDWMIPHAAFLAARDEGQGLVFANHLFRQRFCEGRDVSDNEVLVTAAKACGLDADVITNVTRDKQTRRRLLGIMSTLEAEGIFGVPVFVYGDNQYWGNDRLEWCIREIFRDQGIPVPDLSRDLMARPF